MRFKMKPLKDENEVGSNMKSTIKYTFVVPGAIGKGRGRGLKSLGEKGNTPSKSFLPQSSDLVNKYIKEIETSSIEKNRGQGHKKNSMVHEKENMQINTSFRTSAIQVEKCTQEVETMHPAAIRKGLEKRSGSLSSSLGFSESEVGYFNESDVCANQHMQTPSKSTKSSSTFSSSQEMQKMNRIVLEKEDMQTNVSLPPSCDQVMKHSHTTEKGSSNPTKHDIKQEKLNHMWAAVEHKFESVDMNDHRDHILGWMNELWNKWRGHLHAKYVKDKPIQQSLRNVPTGVDKKEWEWLVKEHFASKSFQARSSRNATNRAKLKMLHHIGSKPIREIIYQKGGKDGNPPDLATIFFETRKKDNKLVEPEAIEKHAQLEEMVQADPSLPIIEIVEKCCGPQTRSHVFGLGVGVKAKDLKGGTSSKAELLSALRSTREDIKFLNEENKSLNEENKSLNYRLSTIEDKMKEIMKMKELFAAQQSHVPPTTSSIPIE